MYLYLIRAKKTNATLSITAILNKQNRKQVTHARDSPDKPYFKKQRKPHYLQEQNS